MTVQEAINTVNRLVTTLKSARARVETVAVKRVEGEMKRRIFNDGRAADGSLIGANYSSRPLYAGRDSFFRKSKFKPRGKNSRSATFRNGRPRKTMYLAGGYEELRRMHGLQTGKVDLMFTGSLMTSIVVGQYKGRIALGIIDKKEILKAGGAEKRYRKAIFTPSQAEIDAAAEAVEAELIKIAQEIGL
jgi:hypothetical protein